MRITDVEWVQNRLGHRALELRIDGRPAHFKTDQRSVLLERGLLAGMTQLRSERQQRSDNRYIRGSYDELSAPELDGCTDDPGVYALFLEMCAAIRAGSWAAGRRPDPATDERAPVHALGGC
jgi:hypothetical protein